MEQLGAVRMLARYRTLIFEFPHGKLDIVEMEMPIRKGERLCEVDGKAMLVHSNSQILAGKLVGRGNMTIARDVFEIIPTMRAHNGTAPDLIAEEHRFTVRLWKYGPDGPR